MVVAACGNRGHDCAHPLAVRRGRSDDQPQAGQLRRDRRLGGGRSCSGVCRAAPVLPQEVGARSNRPARRPWPLARRSTAPPRGASSRLTMSPHRVEGVPPGIVTGYYEPEVNGSRERSGKFQVPVYGRPDDLVQVKPDLLRAFYNDRTKRDAQGRRAARAVLHARRDRERRARGQRDSSCSISTIRSSCSSCRCKAPAACV